LLQNDVARICAGQVVSWSAFLRPLKRGKRIDVLLDLAGPACDLGKPTGHRWVDIECSQIGQPRGGSGIPRRNAFLLTI